MRENLTKRALREGKPAFGCFVRFPDPALVDVRRLPGLGLPDLRRRARHARAARVREPRARGRAARRHRRSCACPVNQPHVILRLMDTGAQGCQVPWVQDAADAERAVQAVKYGPRGDARAGRRARRRLRPARLARRLRAQGQRGDARDRARRERPRRGAGRRDRRGRRGRRRLPRPDRPLALARRARRAESPDRASSTSSGPRARRWPPARCWASRCRRPRPRCAWLERGARYVTTGIEPLLGGATRRLARARAFGLSSRPAPWRSCWRRTSRPPPRARRRRPTRRDRSAATSRRRGRR